MIGRENTIGNDDVLFIDRLRGASILRVVLVHLGLSWFWPPYSEYVLIFLPLLFFVSGAVTYFSFLRAQHVFKFLLRRCLLILTPYYLLVGLIGFGAALLSSTCIFTDLRGVINWIIVNPSSADSPVQIGQVWFLRSLLVMNFLAIPVFLLARRYRTFLLIPVLVAMLLASAQMFGPVHKLFVFEGFNFYAALSNMGFFFFGAWFYSIRASGKNLPVGGLLGICVIAAIAVATVLKMEAGMSRHTYAPNIYYVLWAFAAILLVLFLQKQITFVLNKLRVIDRFLLFFSKHAFSVFLLHSLVIQFLEHAFGLHGVMGNPSLAALKIGLTLVGTMLLAVPFTWVSRKLRDIAITMSNSR
jgi:peptidoglycan/LPS O-acetylase OafA/YrhL